ncbi:hypothetical protein EDB80DRAFT_714811 [Ilyonectria destructans]|nr:hypothetical protein EDB80DRAFT_714811 [Ilyonectria destructans]
MAAKALELRRVVHGEMHPDTFLYIHRLSCICHHLGRVDEAISLEEECFRQERLALGENYPSTQSSARTLELWK